MGGYVSKGIFKDAFNQAVLSLIKYGITEGIITSVDETQFTCSIQITGYGQTATYNDVPLKVIKSSNASIIEIPEINSDCLFVFRNYSKDLPVLISAVLISKFIIIIGSSQILIKDELIQFNGGKNNGLVIGKNLVEQLNNLENDLNILKTAFNAWAPVPNDGGAALKTISANWAGNSLSLSQESQIENKKITQ